MRVLNLSFAGLMITTSALASPYAIGTTVGTQSTTVVPGLTQSPVTRTQVQIYNNSSSGNLWCRDDNQAAVVGTGVKIQPTYGWQWLPPNISPNPINCISDSGTLAVGGSYYQ